MERRIQTGWRHNARGFTLIELMIVVIIVSILAAIGYPSYNEFVTKSRRQAGRNALYQIANRQEQFFLDNKAYAANLTALGYAANTIGLDEDGQFVAVGYAKRTYIVDMINTSATTYTVRAQPQLVQATRDTQCKIYTLTQTGARATSGPGDNCW